MSSPPLSPELNMQVFIADLTKQLGEFIANGPLYSSHNVPEVDTFNYLPSTIELLCLTCKKAQTFERASSSPRITGDKGWGEMIAYRCRNCKERNQKYFYVWQGGNFLKVGQIPHLPEKIDGQLASALGNSKVLYQKAVRARDFGFGIGALAYLRRIVEDTTDSLMELLREDQWDRWSAVEREQFEAAMKTNQYAQKMSYAAGAILPGDLFVGGTDSFSRLHDVTSAGLHAKTEEECLELFDRCNLIFAQSFRVLYQHKQERQTFAADLAKLKR